MDRNLKNNTVGRCVSFAYFLAAFLVILPSTALALDCNNPPRGFGGSWARAYKNWCESCGGTYSSGPRCTPGRNWGGGQQGSTPSYDYEAERQRQEAERLYREEQERQRQKEMEEQRRRDEEEARKLREEFEKNKQEALKSIKGININEPGLKGLDSGSDPGLKGIEASPPLMSDDSGIKPADTVKSRSNEPAAAEIQKSIDAARKRIPQLEKDIKGLQTLLAQFGASQRSNVSELEKWQATFHEAAENSRKNAVDYGLSMFLQYNLMGSLERSVKKDVYGRLDAMINTSDPKMRRWLGEQLKKRNIELSRVQKVVTTGALGGDLAALLSGDLKDSGKTLDALLFVNDLLETTKVVSWAGSQYFQQAKMIGETYSDLAAFGYSAVNIRKAQKATDAYNREILHLSSKLRDSTREMNCLKGCLDNYKDRCFDKCTGKTRFGTPPPTPR